MDRKNISVSIVCNTYNHEKYIADALESFLMQKTDFNFEILIHDDASTDDTAKIIKEYEKKFPDIIKPIYQNENQYSKKIPGLITNIQYRRAEGKYIALCEGDDFWSSPYKLQAQYDALENNKNCVMCVVAVEETDEAGNVNGNVYPNSPIEAGVISPQKMMELMTGKESYPFQTSGYFFRTDVVKKYCEDLPDFRKKANVGDVPLMMYFLTQGSIFYINKIMSCYRRNPKSWSYKNIKTDNILNKSKNIENNIEFYSEFDKYCGYKYHEYIKKYIERARITVAWLFMDNNMYKEVLNRKYRKYIPSNKTKLVYFLLAYCPSIFKLFHNILGSNQKGNNTK